MARNGYKIFAADTPMCHHELNPASGQPGQDKLAHPIKGVQGGYQHDLLSRYVYA
jgi:hypothetical protein